MFVPGRALSYSEDEARAAIAASLSWAETLRRLGLCPTGGAWQVLKKHAQRWNIATDHFRPNGRPPVRRPFEEILVEHSPIRGTKLKRRLYAAGFKQPICELCGQGELWHGQRIALILDHINGVRDDNRLENLRIVCPNCNAGLETHCGRHLRIVREPRACRRCGEAFTPRYDEQTYCSQPCGSRHDNRPTKSQHSHRAPLADLLEAVTSIGYEATGRRYGVSGNAVRKWIKAYGRTPPPGRGREAHPPAGAARALSDEQAATALKLLAGGATMTAIGRRFAVDRTTIRALRDGETYKHLERSPPRQNAA